MSDASTNGKSRSLTNFLGNSPNGTVFIRFTNTLGNINTLSYLDNVVKEIGEENVVQVVTNNASAY